MITRGKGKHGNSINEIIFIYKKKVKASRELLNIVGRNGE